MDSQVFVFELQDDKNVKKHPVTLTFPRPNNGRLSIITNQRSQCLLCRDPDGQRRSEKISGGGKTSEEKNLFQYGVSTKVFSVTDPSGNKWEVRLLLSPPEISRLSSVFNLIGYFSAYLASKESHQDFRTLLSKKKSRHGAEEICKAIAPFLCLLEGDKVGEYCAQLSGILTGTIAASCKGLDGTEAIMIAGGLTALLAAELAISIGGSNVFDYTGEKTECQETPKEQLHQMVETFDVQAEHLEVSHREKTVHVIFRNPCPDNWASGGRKCLGNGEIFEYGLCHKVFSISEAQSEIQFLQSLQESYDMIAAFHIAAFAERLLMTKKWRKTLEALLKEGQKKERINELSQLAAKFVCSRICNVGLFQKYFRKEMTEKWSEAKTLPAGGEAICVVGLLVAIMAALKAKSIADNPPNDTTDSSDEDIKQPVGVDDSSEVAPDCNQIGLPNIQEAGHPKPDTTGPGLEGNGDSINEEAAAGNTGGISRGIADNLGGENIDHVENAESNGTCSSRTPGVGAPDNVTSSSHPDDVSHPCLPEKPSTDQLGSNTDNSVSSSNSKTSGPLPSPVAVLPDADPGVSSGLLEITSTVVISGTCRDGRQDPDQLNVNYPGSSVESVMMEPYVGHVFTSDTCRDGRQDSVEVKVDHPGSAVDRVMMETSVGHVFTTHTCKDGSNIETFGPLDSPVGFTPAVEPQGLPEIISKAVKSDTCRDGRQNPDEVEVNHPVSSAESGISETSVGHVFTSDTCRDGNDIETFEPLESPDGVIPAVEAQDLPVIISKAVQSDTCGDGRQDSDEVNGNSPRSPVESGISETFVGHAHDLDSGSRTTNDEDTIDKTRLVMPTQMLESSYIDTEKTMNQDAQKIGSSNDESFTFKSQNDLSTQISQEQKESDINKLDQRPYYPSDVGQGGEATSQRPDARISFLVLFIFLLVVMASVLLVLPFRMASVWFTGMVLILGVHVFFNRRP